MLSHGWQLCFPLSLHAGGSDFRLYDGSDLNTYILIRWWGPVVLAVVRPTGVYLLDFFCSGNQCYLLLSPYLCFISFYLLLSPFYLLIYDALISYGSFMQTKLLCVLIHIWTKGEVGSLWNRFKTSCKMSFTDGSKAVLPLWIIYVISVLYLLCFRARLFIDALWSPAGKCWTLGYRSWSCLIVTLSLSHWYIVSWVRCGAWLNRFLTVALFLTLLTRLNRVLRMRW